MNERWIDELRAELVDTGPRPGFRDELASTLRSEWHGRTSTSTASPRRRHWWALAGAAASVVALVVGLVVLAGTNRADAPGLVPIGLPPSSVSVPPEPVASTSLQPVPTSAAASSTATPPTPVTSAQPTVTEAPATVPPDVPPDHICLRRILPPPQLVGGGDPGEYRVDSLGDDGHPDTITWGGDGPEAVRQHLQPIFFEEGPTDFIEFIEGSDQFRQASRYEVAVVPVSDPPLGAISLYVRERGTDCIRTYSIGPGLRVNEAIVYAQLLVDELSRDDPPTNTAAAEP